jgi:hypothetical protein
MPKAFDKWVCVFPGKMAICWKEASVEFDTREEAEEQAKKNCNVVAVPVALFDNYKNYIQKLQLAERLLRELGMYQSDIDKLGEPNGWPF